MPYILKEGHTGRVLTRIQRNRYELDYYGTAAWETEEEAVTAAEEESQSGERWEPVEISEQALKLCNVKLKNDPGLALYLDEENRPVVKRTGN